MSRSLQPKPAGVRWAYWQSAGVDWYQWSHPCSYFAAAARLWMFLCCVRARNTEKPCKHSTGCNNTCAAHMQVLSVILYAPSTLLQS